MSEFGFWELALILLVALLVVGPQRLPALLATVGGWIKHIRRLTAQLKSEFAEEAATDEVKKILTDARDTAQQAGSDIKREFVHTDPLVEAIEEQIDKGRFTAASNTQTAAENAAKPKTSKTETTEEQQP